MGKKTNKKKKANINKSPAELEQDGRRYLTNGKYRAAIDIFKQLLKHEEKKEFSDLLEQAYKGRSHELSAKGMFKEAEAIYNIIETKCNTSVKSDEYINILVNSGQYKKVLDIYSGKIDKNREYQIQSFIAALMLNDEDDGKSGLTEDHTLLKDKTVIYNAFSEFVSGRDAECQETLKKISFSSPFRDFKRLISGFQKYYHGENEKALEYINSIPDNSPIKRFSEHAANVVMYHYNESLIKGLSLTSNIEKKLFFLLRGYNIRSITSVNKILHALENNKLYDAANEIRYNRGLIDNESLKKFVHGMYLENIELKKLFPALSEKISYEEDTRLGALFYETHGDLFEANDYWYDFIDEIDEQNKDPNSALIKALVLRRIAENKQKFDNPFGREEYDWVNDIEKSLEYDPYDIDSYKKILGHYKNNKVNLKKWSEIFLNFYPDNIEALTFASNVALGRRSYKKALDYLDRVLKIDPINTGAIDQKISIHITKARKHINDRKYHLARKEFETATVIEKKKDKDGWLQIKWGLLEILDQNEEKGNNLIIEGFSYAETEISAFFITHIEAKRILGPSPKQKIYRKNFLTELQKKMSYGKTISLIKTMMIYIDAGIYYPDREGDINIIVINIKLLWQSQISESDLLTMCEFLMIVFDVKVLKKCATKGIKKFPKSPRFIFYLMYLKLRDFKYIPQNKDKVEIEKCIELAKKNRDVETINRLKKQYALMRIRIGNQIPKDIFDDSFEDIDNEEINIFPSHRNSRIIDPMQIDLFDEDRE